MINKKAVDVVCSQMGHFDETRTKRKIEKDMP
jgi:hypothetical protein